MNNVNRLISKRGERGALYMFIHHRLPTGMNKKDLLGIYIIDELVRW